MESDEMEEIVGELSMCARLRRRAFHPLTSATAPSSPTFDLIELRDSA